MIEVEGLTKFYGPIPAIQDVSFRVEEGEIVGFLGPNAAGKTTTLRILAGCMPATRGTARVAGFDVADAPIEAKRRVGYLPENIALYPEMTVEGFLRYVADVKGVPGRNSAREVVRVMDRCGVTHMRRRQVGHLSKGYRQRVGLAQALLGSPPVLILDEPTVGLDPQQIIEIRNMIKALSEEHTILLSSHILPEVSMTCRRVIIIHQGRIVALDALARAAETSGTTWIDVEVAGPEKAAYDVLKNLGKVIEVKPVSPPGGPTHVFEVVTRGDEDARQAVAGALVNAGLGLVTLQARRRTLEDIFVEAVASEKGQALRSEGVGDE